MKIISQPQSIDSIPKIKDGLSYYRDKMMEISKMLQKENAIVSKRSIRIKELILEEAKNGFLVIAGFEGLQKAKLSEIVKQPVEGLLYDLNRDPVTILTFINDPKWVNDYASMQVIRLLHNKVEELEHELEFFKSQNSAMSADIDKMQDIIP